MLVFLTGIFPVCRFLALRTFVQITAFYGFATAGILELETVANLIFVFLCLLSIPMVGGAT